MTYTHACTCARTRANTYLRCINTNDVRLVYRLSQKRLRRIITLLNEEKLREYNFCIISKIIL